MTIARRPFLVLAATGLFSGWRLALGADLLRGSGVAATQRREIGPFTGVALGASFKVVLRIADREAVEVVADDNVLPLIETRVRGDGQEKTLAIELARNTRIDPRTPIVVTVDVVRLERLALGGSGSIEGKKLKGARLAAAIGGSGSIGLAEIDVDELSVVVGGSGSFRADGRAKTLAVQIGGSGSCDTERLAAAEVSVAVAGSGDARVRADNVLSASIAGSGNVYHRGAAAPQAAIVGSGRIVRL
jgi:hypothetical protein